MWKTTYDEKRKLWHGTAARSLYDPKIGLGEVLLKMMRVHGPKIAQVGFYRILTMIRPFKREIKRSWGFGTGGSVGFSVIFFSIHIKNVKNEEI